MINEILDRILVGVTFMLILIVLATKFIYVLFLILGLIGAHFIGWMLIENYQDWKDDQIR
jgi:hypothetical protein